MKPSPQEELEVKRAKHLFVQWLVSGNRKAVPADAKLFLKSDPDEARLLYEFFCARTRKRPKGKKHLFIN